MRQFIRAEKRHVDDVVHLMTIDRLCFQYADRFVEPVHQQT